MGHWYQYGYTGAMIWLPFYVVLFTGAAIVLGHNTIDFAASAHKGNLPFWWSLLHKQGEFNLWPGHKLFIFYPFLPWSGLMMLVIVVVKYLLRMNRCSAAGSYCIWDWDCFFCAAPLLECVW